MILFTVWKAGYGSQVFVVGLVMQLVSLIVWQVLEFGSFVAVFGLQFGKLALFGELQVLNLFDNRLCCFFFDSRFELLYGFFWLCSFEICLVVLCFAVCDSQGFCDCSFGYAVILQVGLFNRFLELFWLCSFCGSQVFLSIGSFRLGWVFLGLKLFCSFRLLVWSL